MSSRREPRNALLQEKGALTRDDFANELKEFARDLRISNMQEYFA
jgi:hypothetical protein